MILLCAIFLYVTTAKAQTQTDHVITTNGDSITCRISEIFGLKYKSEGMEKAKRINPDNIKEYYIAKKRIWQRSVFREDNTDPIFMTILEKGKINLYQLLSTVNVYGGVAGGSSMTSNIYFISKGSDNVIEIKTNGIFSTATRKSRKDFLATLLMDDSNVYNKYLAEDKFSFAQIRKLVHLYNTGEELQLK